MGYKDTKVLSHADNAVLIAESDNDLQKLVHHFKTTAKSLKWTDQRQKQMH